MLLDSLKYNTNPFLYGAHIKALMKDRENKLFV